MIEERVSLATQRGYEHTILVRAQLLSSLRDREYRNEFVKERVHSSVALQIRALRSQRNSMTQKVLGDAIGMAQTWVSKLEDPDYGKLTVATLLRLAGAFDTDLEIKFRPFSRTLDALTGQGPDYFFVPSFYDEFNAENLAYEDMAKIQAIDERRSMHSNGRSASARSRVEDPSTQEDCMLEKFPRISKTSAMMAVVTQEQNGNRQGSTRQGYLAV